MLLKLNIIGELELVTGMHIGGTSEFSAIGAVDSPIVKDNVSKLPYIPGSSLKGKMRYLLSRKYNDRLVTGYDDDGEEITRIFGSTKKDENDAIKTSRINVSDMMLTNLDELEAMDVSTTEVKFENTIDRRTAIANPRQIERATKGSKFNIDIIYTTNNIEELERDLELINESFELLRYDYIGGNGSRGYGRVKFKDLEVVPLIGEIDPEILDKINKTYKRI